NRAGRRPRGARPRLHGEVHSFAAAGDGRACEGERMPWLASRQQRQQALFGAVSFVLLAIFLLLTGRHMHSVFGSSGLWHCLATRNHGDCGDLESAFETRFGTLRQLVPFLMVLPGLVGLFWGAPLLARELEQGTHRLVW